MLARTRIEPLPPTDYELGEESAQVLARRAMRHAERGNYDMAAQCYDEAADRADADGDHEGADELRESAAAYWQQTYQRLMVTVRAAGRIH